MKLLKSRDGSVGIALGYGLDDRGSRVGSEYDFVSHLTRTELYSA